MKLRLFAIALAVLVLLPQLDAANPKPVSAKKFDALSTAALEAMKARAAELKISGVAVVSYARCGSGPNDTIQSWSSKMAVVGHMTDPVSAASKGNNLLAIAYAKAAEMARTLVNSGTAAGPPMTGEFGWQGGVIARVKAGYLIVAFSGGKSEDDVETSKAGLAALQKSF
jgi:hypothetical protein